MRGAAGSTAGAPGSGWVPPGLSNVEPGAVLGITGGRTTGGGGGGTSAGLAGVKNPGGGAGGAGGKGGEIGGVEAIGGIGGGTTLLSGFLLSDTAATSSCSSYAASAFSAVPDRPGVYTDGSHYLRMRKVSRADGTPVGVPFEQAEQK